MKLQGFKYSMILAGALILFIFKPVTPLQGGPAMPEYAQFESADIPDIVNLNTGDFVYSIPLADIPGPYGNYPMSMSYHAGITPAQEATWVGLGWTLNPGAINRNLRGVPDDQFHGSDLAYIYSYARYTNWSVGVGLSSSGFNFGMTYNSQTGYGVSYGIGLSSSIDLGVSFNQSGDVGVNASVGTKGGVGVSAGLGITNGNLGGSVGLSKGGVNGTVAFSKEGVSGSLTAGKGARSKQGATLNANLGVQVNTGGKITPISNMSIENKSGVGARVSGTGTVSATNGVVTLSKNITDGQNGGTSVTVGNVGLSVASSNGGHRSTVNTQSAFLLIPLPPAGLFLDFSYSKTTQESWVRQATEENIYGYMYQAGPALFVDKHSSDFDLTGTPVGGNPGIPWHWNMKGKALEHDGNPRNGDMQPAYDIFSVSADGMNGTFRAQGLSNHKMHMSVLLLNPIDEQPQVLYNLLREDTATLRQFDSEFDFEEGQDPTEFSRYAYDYCYFDSAFQYTGLVNDPPADGVTGDGQTLLEKIEAGECSKYAVLQSTHLNESNRLLLNSDLSVDRNFRSRMVFRFIGENSGHMNSEPTNSQTGKYGQDQLNDSMFQRNVDGSWNYGIFGSRKIEPILEGAEGLQESGSNLGRLKGFKITRADGTEYFFTQPVRSLLNADYTTNQKFGMPLFVDKRVKDQNYFLFLAEGYAKAMDWVDSDPLGAFFDVSGFIQYAQTGWIGEFLFGSEAVVDKCEIGDPDERLNFSYSMRTNPYATQWLITEVRGPEFVLLDDADMSKNMGYQIKFHYDASPDTSDSNSIRHYQWRFPYARPGLDNSQLPNFRLARTGKTPENCSSELYHGSFGVKELVYLNAIETATHRVEFKTNDATDGSGEERKDGKGWIHDLTQRGDSVGSTQKSAVPIFLNTNLEANVTDDELSWNLECAEDTTFNVSTGVRRATRMCWYEKDISLTADKLFLNMQLTDAQKKHMLDDQKGHGANVTLVGLRQVYTDTAFVAPDTSQEYPGISIDTGIVAIPDSNGFLKSKISAIDSTVLDDMNKGVQVLTYAGESSAVIKGLYIPLVWSCRYEGPEVPIDWHCDDPNPTSVFDTNITDPGEPLISNLPTRVTFSGPNNSFKEDIPPQLAFTDFVFFNNPGDNQTSYLEEITYFDKSNLSEPIRKYRLEHTYDLQPRTLNSYEGSVNIDSAYYPNKSPAELGGKLTLRSIQEIACAGIECAQETALPPFRFGYNDESATTFRTVINSNGVFDWDSSIIASAIANDEWGFWNQLATFENHKVHQGFADKGGTAWSLNHIVDPLGGVMEVHYERDTYHGEWYGEDDMPAPITFRRCGDTSRGTNDPSPPEAINDDHLCIDFIPRKWKIYCNRSDLLTGEWDYEPGGDWDYMTNLNLNAEPGINKEVYFQLNGAYQFDVKCGFGFGRYRLSDCERERMVGILGSGRIIQQFQSDSVLVPYLAIELGTDNPRATTQTIELDVFYQSVEREMLKAGKDFVDVGSGSMHPTMGTVLIQKISDEIKGGDIRVTKLVKRDIGLEQTTMYKYGVGEMAQYPDSVLSSGFAQRFAPVKVVRTMPNVRLPAKSRITGIGDHELNYLPHAKVSYPDVTVFNTVIEGMDTVILNGKTEYEFFSPEGGIKDSQEDPGNPDNGFLKVKVLVSMADGISVDTNELFELHFLDGQEPKQLITIPGLSVTFNPVSDSNKTEFVFDFNGVDNNVLDQLKLARAVRVGASFEDPGPDFSVTVEDTLLEILDKPYIELLVGLTVESDDLFQTTVSDIKQSAYKPILVRTTDQDADSVSYNDYTAYLGKPRVTRFWRWLPDSETDKNIWVSDVDEEDSVALAAYQANEAKYRLIKKDSILYSPNAPSADIRFISEAQTQKDKIGLDQETWEYSRDVQCGDPHPLDCSDSTFLDYRDFEEYSASAPRKITYNRFSVFNTGVVQTTGFNNSESEDDYLVTVLQNHQFDVVTGNPTLSVKSATANPNGPTKATLMTPAYQVNDTLGQTMFKRNLLTQNFREEVYTWTVAATSDNSPSGTPIDFTTFNAANHINRLSLLQITPFKHDYFDLTVEGIATDDHPILSMGVFTPRFDLKDANNSTLLENLSLLTPSFTDPQSNQKFFLQNWQGSEIVEINRRFQPLEVRGPYGRDYTGQNATLVEDRATASRYEPRGFHQIGLFGNAAYSTTVCLTPEGYISPFNSAEGEDIWVFENVTPTLENGFIRVTGAFNVKHRMDIKQDKPFTIETQIYSASTQEIEIGFETAGGVTKGDRDTLSLMSGLHSYRIELTPDGTYCPSGVCPADNYIGLFGVAGNDISVKYYRAYPKIGEAMTFVYDYRGNLLQSVDVNNLSNYFTYDSFNNLITIRNDDGLAFSAQKRIYSNRDGVTQ